MKLKWEERDLVGNNANKEPSSKILVHMIKRRSIENFYKSPSRTLNSEQTIFPRKKKAEKISMLLGTKIF